MLIDNLWNLLDSGMFDTQGPVNNALVGSIASVLETQYSNGEALINNLSPKTADVNGIAVWEQILDLPSDTSLTLQQRQQRCAAKAYRLTGALTKQQLVDILNVFGSSTSAIVTEVPSQYKVFGQLVANDVKDDKAVIRAVKSVLPAHLQYVPTYLSEVPEFNTPSSRSLLNIIRYIYSNNGGATDNGLFLDNSWKLDGTKVMNNLLTADLGTSSFDSLIISIAIAYGQYLNTEGSFLNGGKPLDNSWSLSGTYTIPDPFGHQMNVILTRLIQMIQSQIHSSALNIQRTVFAQNGGPNNNSMFLDSSWKLDGTAYLNNGFEIDFATTDFTGSIFSRTIDFRQQTDMTGIILDGHRNLDNSWNLIGTTLIPDPIGKVVTMNGTTL
jgi:hypothetical protein